ncbi:MAG: tetratricopeptide repeat protein [Cypionkella sp.]
MTCKPSTALLLALALAACGARAPPAPADGWQAMLARGDGTSAEARLRGELAAGQPAAALAPYLGEAALLRGDLAEARRWLGDARFAPGSAAHGYRMLARLHLAEGDLSAAGRALDRSLALDEGNPEVWVDIARLRYRGGEQAQALGASQRALRLGPDNPAALLLRAQLLRDAEGHAAALPLLERGRAAAPADRELLAEYAATLGELGRANDMLAAVRRLPPGPRPLYLQAVLAARARQNDLARSLLQRSGDLDRQMPAATLLRAVLDLEQGNAQSAAQGLDNLLRRQPNNRRVRLLLARALAQGGNHRELVARFAGSADTPYLAALVGRAYEALGDRTRAAPYLERARAGAGFRAVPLPSPTALAVAEARGPVDGAGAVALVRGLVAAGRANDATRAARAFLARHAGSADAMALAGDAALAAGDPAGALTHYRNAAEIRRPWPLTRRMTLALRRLGREDEAAMLVRRHLRGEPGNAEARALLADLAAG